MKIIILKICLELRGRLDIAHAIATPLSKGGRPCGNWTSRWQINLQAVSSWTS